MILYDVVFWGAFTVVLGLVATLLLTLAVPGFRIWPPPGRETWQYRLTWTLFDIGAVGFLVVGGLDAGSLGLTQWLAESGTLIVGSALFAFGTALASYAMGYLGRQGALGLEAGLVTDGPFALSRNPGYLGDLILIAGYTILTDSRLAGIVGLAAAVWFVLAPFAEEPWLEERYGEAYRRYKERCPRFIGWAPL
ncbi:methyltransferase family protein [Salinibacter sp.]|uniref:methyltransferase family protein n=1 Tax=Salinibacter sp. TaxID=2065818 RepID=UPI0021E7853C|nr:PEMT/PEM2 methyltransferase family protein [Salinibacter sp.]